MSVVSHIFQTTYDKQWLFFHLMPKTQMYFVELEAACTFRVKNFIVITLIWLM